MEKSDYPMPHRDIEYDEIISWCDNLVSQLTKWEPEEIVGVARGGMPFATFVAQKMNLQLGYYNPNVNKALFATNAKRIAFVDDNFMSGGTQRQIREFMLANHPDIDYVICCVMLDYYCPDKDCIYGKFLDFWADSIPCYFKKIDVTKAGIRYRDNEDVFK